ncbi:hypothetical protein D3C80_1056450 [compost metagenome]
MQEVGQEQEEQGHAEVHVGLRRRRPGQQQEAGADQDQGEGELDRGRGLHVALAQPHPQGGDDRAADDDDARVEHLGHGGIEPRRHRRRLVREQGQRRAGLFKQGPEQDREEDQRQGDQHTAALCAPQLEHHIADDRGEDDASQPRQGRFDQVVTLHQQPDREDGDQAADPEDGLERHAEDLAGLEHFRVRRTTATFQPALPQDEGEQAQKHADTGQTKAIGPAILDAEVGTGRRGQHGTQVDADVEDSETAVATGIVLFIQGADDGRDIGLQEADADDDQRQGEEQDRLPKAKIPNRFQLVTVGGGEGREALRRAGGRRGGVRRSDRSRRGADAGDAFRRDGDLGPLIAVDGEDAAVLIAAFDLELIGRGADGQVLTTARPFERHHEVTGDQKNGADDDGLARAQVFVRDHAADNRHQVHQGRIGGVDALGLFRSEQEVLGQVEDQQGPHAVVGEALPHFCKEQDHQPPRVS